MKGIFLDFDGVICTLRAHCAYSDGFMWSHLDPVAVKMIERLANETDSKIVVSSTWRSHWDKGAIERFLLNAGMRTVPFHQSWRTPNLNAFDNNNRGSEIAKFLSDHHLERYVIIDDDSDMLAEQMPFFVKTDPLNGFMWEHFEKAKEILKGKE